MIVETDFFLSDDVLYAFLKGTKYQLYNFWPVSVEDAPVRLLFDEIRKLPENNIVKAFHNNELIALLVFENLLWDTSHFGFKCVRIRYILTRKNVKKDILAETLKKCLVAFRKHCITNNIKFVSADIDSQEQTTSLALQQAGFRYILTWVNGFIKEPHRDDYATKGSNVGEIRPSEVKPLSNLAEKHYFKGGRFYSDPGFDKRKVDKLYGNLVKSSFENNEIMLVYRIHDEPVGLFICKNIVTYKLFSGLRVAPLRFLVIDPRYRQKKIAQDLFAKTIGYLSDKSDMITTGLEVHNLPSLNLHIKFGFIFNYTHTVYHWWNQDFENN